MALSPAPERLLSVTQLTALIKGALGNAFPALWVKGELTGVKRYGTSGHLYFSLKDRGAMLGAVMWRTRNVRLAFEPENGMEVEAFGSITVFEARGQYQLVVEEMRPAGRGALLVALEKLRRRLGEEGLFAAERKRALPPYPRRVGLVTSPVGAAIRDLIKVLRQRWPSIGIVLAPVRVQGEGASAEISDAIRRFSRLAGVDVLIVGRGGGSIEDLWAFNEESVVRAIVASPIPVISAVGHEVDVTLADLAADVRASTPSNAAELAVPVRAEVAKRVRDLRTRLDRAAREGMDERRRVLDHLTGKYAFRRQGDALRLQQQRVDDLIARLRGGLQRRIAAARGRLDHLSRRYGLREWPRRLAIWRVLVTERRQRMTRGLERATRVRRDRLAAGVDRLRGLAPQRVLERGYCLVRGPDGTLLRSADGIAVGELLQIEFARGGIDARVETLRRGGSDGG